MTDIETKLAAFVAHCQSVFSLYATQTATPWPVPQFRAGSTFRNWCKIFQFTATDDGIAESTFAFIAMKNGSTEELGKFNTGDIFKPNGHGSPAKHARGNVFTSDFNNCVTPFGISYIHSMPKSV